MIVTLSDIGTTTLSNASGSASISACGAIASAVAPRVIRGAAVASRGAETRCAAGDDAEARGRDLPKPGDLARPARPSR